MEELVQILSKNADDLKDADDDRLNRFAALFGKYFNLYSEKKTDPENKLKEANNFAKFHLPLNTNELFLTYNEAPLFWISDLPLNKYIKDFYKYHLPKSNFNNLYDSQREAYTNWLMIKSEAEKKYFASTVINLVEKCGIKNNFLGMIFNGVIFSYDSQMFNPEKAIELFKQAKTILNSIKINLGAMDELNYLLELFSAYSFLKMKKEEEAQEKLISALSAKPNGTTAKFHLALTNICLDHPETSEYLIKEIFADESAKFEYAVEEKNMVLLKFLLEHIVLINIKQYQEFSFLTANLEQYFEPIASSNEEIINALKIRIEKIEHLNVVQAYSEGINTKILFIKNVIVLINSTKNIYLLKLAEYLQSDFKNSANEIISMIKKKYYGIVGEKLKPIDEEIQKKSGLINQLGIALEEKKSNLKSKLKKSIDALELNISDEIAVCDEKIKMLSDENNSKTHKIFMQTMGYNTILTIIVTVMGGCAGYSKSHIRDISELKELLSTSLLTGLKWGIMTFLAGLLISALVTGFSLLERSNERQKLLRRISRLKNEGNQYVTKLKKDAELKERELFEVSNSEMNRLKVQVEELLQEKEKNERDLKVEAERLFKEEAHVFEEFVS